MNRRFKAGRNPKICNFGKCGEGKKASNRFGHSRTHSHSHSHSVFCGLAKNLRPGAQACLPAGRELESEASENVGREIKNSVLKYFTLTTTLTLYFVASPRIYAQAHRPACRQAGNLNLKLLKMWGEK